MDQKFSTDDAFVGEGNKNINSILDCFTVEYEVNNVKIAEITDPDAKAYYVKACQFSRWVNDNLRNITAENAKDNIVDESGKPLEVYEKKIRWF